MCSEYNWPGKKQNKETTWESKRYQSKIQLGLRPADNLSREDARS